MSRAHGPAHRALLHLFLAGLAGGAVFTWLYANSTDPPASTSADINAVVSTRHSTHFGNTQPANDERHSPPKPLELKNPRPSGPGSVAGSGLTIKTEATHEPDIPLPEPSAVSELRTKLTVGEWRVVEDPWENDVPTGLGETTVGYMRDVESPMWEPLGPARHVGGVRLLPEEKSP